jgi:transposase
VARTALTDILGEEVNDIDYRDLYANLDKLHPQRVTIEKQLFEREKNLFNLEETLFLYDLTSTYMEGKCEGNPAAKHGYSRDSRPDCRQQVLGLMVNKDRFPIGHEIFAGNTSDSSTVKTAIDTFESRTGIKKAATMVVDRGMSDKANLEMIKARGHHYIVAAKQTERVRWLAEFESEDGWQELMKQS